MTVTAAPAPVAAPPIRRRAGSAERPPELTVPQMFRSTVERCGDHPALMHKVGKAYQPITYRELAERVRRLALGLVDLGVQPGDRVALLSENRPEWAEADLAILSIGGVNVPLYSTLPPPQVQYILADCGATIVLVSSQKQLDKVLEVQGELPDLRHVVLMDTVDPMAEGVVSLESIRARGDSRPSSEYDERRAAVRPHDRATIIYTSGTTGAPKGAVLSHDNFMSNAQAVMKLVDVRPDDTFLSFLPLSHVFERMAGQYLPLMAGSTVAYAESVFTVRTNIAEVRPTVMASVPRLYETIHSRVQDECAKLPEKQRKIAEWARKVGWERNSRHVEGKGVSPLTALLYKIADSLVLAKIREKSTGGRLRFFISGGAPLPMETARYITALGIRMLEGYGLTETSPVICVNLPEKTKLGYVGPPIPGVEVAIAEDGEILSRGPHIMEGYFNQPEATAQAIDADGWFHTGDIGELDADDFLKITDRKKDILVLANGKNVAPQPIEAKVKASQYIAQVVLFGDRQPQVVALIVPDFDHLKAWAKEKGIGQTPEELVASAEVKKLLRQEIDRNTKDLADFEMIRRFAVLPRDFSQERGELTPTLKIKRKAVAENYAAEIQGLYGGRSEG